MADVNAFSYPPFDKPIIDQIDLRQFLLGNNPVINDDPTIQNWKFNNSAWIRLASSINLDIQTDSTGSIIGGGVPLIKKLVPNANPLTYSGDRLAKSYVLYGGVSSVLEETTNNNSKILVSNLDALTNTNDYFVNSIPDGDFITSTYGFSGLEQGIRPMPGIKSINITYLNRGTNARAEIEIIAFNREQLGIIETLYMHPGYNVLLEWGHSSYPDNTSKQIIQQSDNNTAAFTKLFSGTQFNVGTMAKLIHNESLARSGNYEAMFGPVSNFNYKFNPDGTYSITVYMQSVGLLSESLKLNTSSANGKYQPAVSKLRSELEIKLKKQQEELDALLAQKAQAERDVQSARTQYNSRQIESDNARVVLQTRNGPKDTGNYNDYNALGTSVANAELAKKTIEDEILKLQPEPTPDNLVSSLKFANILNYWLDAQNTTLDNYLQDNSQQSKSWDVVTEDGNLYRKGFATSTKNIKQNLDAKTNSIISEPQQGTESYIRLGALLQFISNNLLIYNEDKTPIFSIDYDLESNVCTRHKFSISSDPTICVISNPELQLDSNSSGKTYTPEDKLNKIAPFPTTNNNLLGYTMNIFVNLNFAATVAVQYTDVDGNVSLFDYLRHLMNGIKAALGYINDWEVSYENLQNQIVIKELAYRKAGVKIPSFLAKFNIYGFDPLETTSDNVGSFVENVEFNVTLDSKFQTNAVVNAQSQGSNVLGEDTTALATYNNGLIDRTFKSKISQNLYNLTPEQKQPENFNATEIQRLTELAIAFYGGSQSIDTEKIGEFGNILTTVGKYLVSYQVKTNKRTPKNVIPFDLSLTIMGLGGMKLYEKYTTDDKILPPNFSSLNFIVKAVSHTVTGNKWLTKIQSLAVASPDGKKFVDETKYKNIVAATEARLKRSSNKLCPTFIPRNGGNPGLLTPGSNILKSLKEANYIKSADFASFKASNNNKIKFASIIATQEGYNNASTLGYKNNNPGNIVGKGNNGSETINVARNGASQTYTYAKYKTKKDGWDALINNFVNNWIINGKLLPYAGSTVYPECFKDQDNQYFKANGIPITEGVSYNYVAGNTPTLRQYIYQFCPPSALDSTNGYIANVYKSLVAFGVNITSIDEPMTNYIK